MVLWLVFAFLFSFVGRGESQTDAPLIYSTPEYARVPHGTMVEHFEPVFKYLLRVLRKRNKYNKHIAPKPSNEPIRVRVGLNIQSIDEINEKNREMRLNTFVRIAWLDERLKFKAASSSMYVVGDDALVDKIWQPDVYFPNGRAGRLHDLTVHNTNLRIYSNGLVMVVRRYTLAFSCDMDFRLFPFDTQVCSLMIESIKYPDTFMHMSWMFSENDMKPELIKLSKFYMTDFSMKDCVSSYPIGTFSCLLLRFKFEREIFYHLVETFLPSVIIISGSWVSFWLHPTSAPARTGLGVTTMLTIFNQANYVKSSLPPLSDLKVDV